MVVDRRGTLPAESGIVAGGDGIPVMNFVGWTLVPMVIVARTPSSSPMATAHRIAETSGTCC